MSSDKGTYIGGETYVLEFHWRPAAGTSERILSGKFLEHFAPCDAYGPFHFLCKQPVYGGHEFSGSPVGEEPVVPYASEVLVRYMGDEPFEEFLGWQGHLRHLSSVMVEIFEGDGIAVVGLYPGLSDGRAFEVFSEVVDGSFPVRGLFVEMYDPVFFPEGVEKPVQFLFVGEVRNRSGEAQPPCVELVSDKFHDSVLPEALQDAVVEVESANPFTPVCGKTSGGGGKMDVAVPFEIPSESVDGKEYSREDLLLFRNIQNYACGQGGELAHQVSVRPYDWLKFARNGEGDVLPGCPGQPCVRIGDPLVCRLFPAWRAESRLAGVRGIEDHLAEATEEPVEAQGRGPADEQLDHVDNNGRPDEMAFPEEKLPPVAIVEENFPYRYCAA